MFNKSEKKYYLAKILAVLVVAAFVALAFVNPKPDVQHIEKPYTNITHAQ